ncbi:MAG: CPBP family intramembrane metalloprotease [Ruminococcus sp.]|nr:CPBP family intramembrane metalloprotease [Ruminococcus sp.]
MDNIVKGKKIINVIDEFDYTTQDETYNENFRSWRKRKGNKYSFDFQKNERERVYIDGRGFVENSCEYAEKKVLSQIFHTLGYAALMWLVFDTLIADMLIYFLDFLGLDIHISFANSVIYGGSNEVAVTLILMDTIKILLPMLYLHFKLKIPHKAEIMGNMNNPSALVGAIAAAFIASAVASIPSAYSSETSEAITFFGAANMDVSIWNQFEFIAYSLFNVLVIPIISQLLFCGAAFTALRQFGDAFAMLITSLTAAALTQDFRVMPAVFIITLVGCCGMLTSGSVFTAIAVNIVFRMYQMTLALIETDSSSNMPMIRNLFMAVIVVIGAIGLLYFRWYMKNNKLRLARYNSELSFGKRLLHASKTFPFSAVIILCIICAAMEAFT